MDYIELRKRKLFKKYHESDIFNIKTEPNMNKTYRPSLHKTVQPSLDKTKSDIFNTKEKNGDLKKSKTVTKRKLHLKNYKSDIFNTNVNDINRKKSCKRINVNYSTCFDGIKNDEEYKKNLTKYTLTHRPRPKKYEIDKYFNKESAVGRYYKELYGDEKSGVFPEKSEFCKTVKNSPSKNIINTFKNNMKNFENRKKNLKRELTELNNDIGIDGKKRPKENLGKENKTAFNKKKVDIYGQGIDNKNNKKLIKDKNGILFNPKLNKQLEFQSNIFNEQNKDINKKMDDYLNNKEKESEHKKILKEKIKKEREEMNKKLTELRKQNLEKGNTKLHPSTLKWTDRNAELYFKKTYTMGNSNNNKEEEINAFQRKQKDLADSNNIDILSKANKSFNIKKLKKNNDINDDDDNILKIKDILNTLPTKSLRIDQKINIINKSTTSNFLNNWKNDQKLKNYYKSINNNIKSARQSKSKIKKDNIIKIMGKNSKINKNNKTTNNSKNKNDYKVHNYTLVYSTKYSKFDKFGNDDIKKIFGKKGIHIYDVRKNELSVGDLNNVKFKVKESEENSENNIEEKIKLVEEDLIKNKYKVNINKDKIKKLTKDSRNPAEKEAKRKINKTPYKSKGIKYFTNQFPKVDLKYKNFHKE